MAILAIKGHKTRGREVIALLEMLGGHQCGFPKEAKMGYWFISRYNNINAYSSDPTDLCDDFTVFTLEEFEAKFPYKVGDKVTHNMGIMTQITNMYWDNECNVIRYDIESPVDNNYKLMGMLAEHLQPYKEQTSREEAMENFIATPPTSQDKGTLVEIDLTREFCIADKVRIVLGDYEIKEEGGETYLVKKRPKYPKTYEECCEIMGIKYPIIGGEPGGISASTYRITKIRPLIYLLICRDAYWKIAGEQMGLGKPWEPDWLNDEQDKYVLFTHNNAICSNRYVLGHNILAFPTPEMRDAFYDNFKDLIENCKELL